jgi:hypothetical protein
MAVDRVVVGAALWDAENRLADDPAYVAELTGGTAADLPRREGVVPPQPWPADRVSDMPLRDFTGGPGRGLQLRPAAPAVEHETIILLGTGDDDARAHVQTGRALAWAWLRLTVSGVSAQPLGQSFDDAAGRRRLAHDLRLVGHPQFHVRGGARRRPVDDVLAVQYASGDRSVER